MASRCSSASLAASPASFQPSNAATPIVLCSSGNEALTSGEVTQLAYDVIMVAARRAVAVFHRRRGRVEIGSAAILLTSVISTLPTRSAGAGAHGWRNRRAGRVALGVQTSCDDVDFSGR